jgi:uncharacterized membrane protein YfcA
MSDAISLLTADQWVVAVVGALIAGLVKGVVGFALPMVMISILGSVVSPELALAGLILPTLVTNGQQALRQGVSAAWSSVVTFRVFMLTALFFLLISAQLIRVIPNALVLGAIGGMVIFFSLLQLSGRRIPIKKESKVSHAAIGALTGFVGGLSAVWGPPTVAFLTVMDVEKKEHIRTQGVIYGVGALALTFSHLSTGILNQNTLIYSAIMVPAAIFGMRLGRTIQDRIDQSIFMKATLFVLMVAGVNLIRRAFFA